MEKYQNLIIYYFSGTGNARNAGQWMIDVARERGLTTQLINIDHFEKIEIPKLDGKTLFGICSATHGFNLPPLMLEFVNKFPKNKIDADIFILNTRGGMKMYKIFTPGLSGAAQFLPAIIFKIKGYNVVGMQPMDMPSNWISLHPGLRNKVVESIHTRCKRICKKSINKMLDGRKIYKALWSLPLDLAILPVTIMYYFVARFMLAKTFYATSVCTDCGLCQKQCPVSAIIKIDKRMYWKYNCESCMRCMNNCPVKAIQTGHGFITIASWLAAFLFGLMFYFVTKDLLKSVFDASMGLELIRQISGYVFSVFFIFALYKVNHYLMRFKLYGWLIEFTSLTRISLWRRYKAKRNF